MKAKTCNTCKYWRRGVVFIYAPTAKIRVGNDWIPHPQRGTIEFRAQEPWTPHGEEQILGQCWLASIGEYGSRPLAQAVCGMEGTLGELVTTKDFGCVSHVFGNYEDQIYEQVID